MPDHGACIFIHRPAIEVIVFKKFVDKFKTLLIYRKDNQSTILREVSETKDYNKLYEDCLIFELDETLVKQ